MRCPEKVAEFGLAGKLLLLLASTVVFAENKMF
jgi:hypothetical protein